MVFVQNIWNGVVYIRNIFVVNFDVLEACGYLVMTI